jgi:hypothetical protein
MLRSLEPDFARSNPELSQLSKAPKLKIIVIGDSDFISTFDEGERAQRSSMTILIVKKAKN